MAKTYVKVAGLRQLGEAMKSMSADMRGKVGRAAANAGAQVIKKKAIALAPISDKPHQLGVRKGEIVQPGNLRKNIIVKRLPDTEKSLSHQYIIGVRHGSGKAGKDAFYWKFLEFGTAKMAARPFMRPAFESSKTEAVDKIKSTLKQRIDKANKK